MTITLQVQRLLNPVGRINHPKLTTDFVHNLHGDKRMRMAIYVRFHLPGTDHIDKFAYFIVIIVFQIGLGKYLLITGTIR